MASPILPNWLMAALSIVTYGTDGRSLWIDSILFFIIFEGILFCFSLWKSTTTNQ